MLPRQMLPHHQLMYSSHPPPQPPPQQVAYALHHEPMTSPQFEYLYYHDDRQQQKLTATSPSHWSNSTMMTSSELYNTPCAVVVKRETLTAGSMTHRPESGLTNQLGSVLPPTSSSSSLNAPIFRQDLGMTSAAPAQSNFVHQNYCRPYLSADDCYPRHELPPLQGPYTAYHPQFSSSVACQRFPTTRLPVGHNDVFSTPTALMPSNPSTWPADPRCLGADGFPDQTAHGVRYSTRATSTRIRSHVTAASTCDLGWNQSGGGGRMSHISGQQARDIEGRSWTHV